MDFLKDFGFNPVLLIAQVINFLIILYLLKRFMYKPLLTMLKKREDEIKDGLNQAEEGKRILTQAEEKEKEILQKAHSQAEKIILDAKKEAEEQRQKAEDVAKKEAQRILEAAKETIGQETKIAEERLTLKVGEIAIALLEKSLKGIFGEKEQKTIMEKAVKELRRN